MNQKPAVGETSYCVPTKLAPPAGSRFAHYRKSAQILCLESAPSVPVIIPSVERFPSGQSSPRRESFDYLAIGGLSG